jgi:hypothetical protein
VKFRVWSLAIWICNCFLQLLHFLSRPPSAKVYYIYIYIYFSFWNLLLIIYMSCNNYICHDTYFWKFENSWNFWDFFHFFQYEGDPFGCFRQFGNCVLIGRTPFTTQYGVATGDQCQSWCQAAKSVCWLSYHLFMTDLFSIISINQSYFLYHKFSIIHFLSYIFYLTYFA